MAARNCPECGGLVASTINVCPHCGFVFNDSEATRASRSQVPNPYTSLVWAIFALVFFWPCGVVSLVYYFKSDTCWQNGDIFYAEHYGKTSTTWAKVPVWIMLGVMALLFISLIITVALEA